MDFLESIQLFTTSFVSTCGAIIISFCQLLAMIVISVGIVRALIIFLKNILFQSPSPNAFRRSRLTMGYSFSLGLSFLIGATILKTMTYNRWDDLILLLSIIGIRTLLNYLLLQAIEQSKNELPHTEAEKI